MGNQITLNIQGNTFVPTKETRLLLDQIGGVDTLRRVTTSFYTKVFHEPHLEVFFHEANIELHANRLANWVAEKMGGYVDGDEKEQDDFSDIVGAFGEVSIADSSAGSSKKSTARVKESDPGLVAQLETEDCAKCESSCPLKKVRGITNGIKECNIWQSRHPWTVERETKRDLASQPIVVSQIRRGMVELVRHNMVVHDRSTAHYAGWHSVKRAKEDVGKHFELDDCRVWLRLHFWACRECGLFVEHSALDPRTKHMDESLNDLSLSLDIRQRFEAWYVRFLSHFVRIYERTAPPFAPVESSWSTKKGKVQMYLNNLSNGRPSMPEVIGIKLDSEALRKMESEDVRIVKEMQNNGWPRI